ncbi:MAG TPA: tRNA (guanosine(46)-N7)-methyltransferase TrmB [Betaproteobacteria bacterium]|nr:tRNA (guanosine(46)-N7)-methyltransferase TrmB [Betaproteobacteria bacterium]
MTTEFSRPIRSFVLRQGRISPAQARALDGLWPRYGVPYAEASLDLERLFGRAAPKILEIGFGMGEATAQIARAYPENDYLGVEVHGPGVGSLLKQAAAEELTNVRVIRHDAMEVVRHMLAPASLDGAHIFFPDPWHKKRHHKRRLIQPALAALLADRLKPGGYVHAATDWQDYAEHILAVFTAEPKLANAAAGYAPRPAYRPRTKFEQRGLRLGHGVWDIVFRRC